MRSSIPWLFGAMSALACGAAEPAVSLDSYLDLIRQRHPFFTQEALSADIAGQIRDRFLGDEDWELTASPAYVHDDTVEVGFVAPDRFDNVRFEAGAGRSIWRTGGRLDLFLHTDFRDQEFNQDRIDLPGIEEGIDLAGPSRFHRNRMAVAYTQPLWQNRGGGLSRLEYDLQRYAAEQVNLEVLESQESFLLGQALDFLEWVQQQEERQIAGLRLQLAEDELESTRKRLEANLVEDADFYRAKNAVLEAERTLRRVESVWKARQIQLSVQAGEDSLRQRSPTYDVYALKPLPDADRAVHALREEARILRRLRLRESQLERERAGLSDAAKPEMDLVVAAGLKDGDETFDRSVDFDQPDATIAIEYRFPLGNRTARADLARNVLERHQVQQEIEVAALSLESEARGLLTQLSELESVLALNLEQVRTAGERTRAEEQLYRQGRNPLNFVIQSRDAEAVARQVHALNAVEYHALWFRLQAVLDRLWPGGP